MGDQDRRAGRCARFQVDVGLCRIRQVITLVDRDLHLAAGHHAEQRAGRRFQVFAFRV
jgi:hypothetical protein